VYLGGASGVEPKSHLRFCHLIARSEYGLPLVVSEEAPARFELLQSFPNPFNLVTTISFTLPEASSAALTVHDALGRTVATLVNGPMSAGTHSATFNGSKLASGVYFYQFESAGLTRTGKILLLKCNCLPIHERWPPNSPEGYGILCLKPRIHADERG
jgi:hypothetical protein